MVDAERNIQMNKDKGCCVKQFVSEEIGKLCCVDYDVQYVIFEKRFVYVIH
jgi:hypothetical protein